MVNPNKVTERLFRSPSKYIQGPYAIQNAAKYLGQLGKAPLLICDNVVWDIGASVVSSLCVSAMLTIDHRRILHILHLAAGKDLVRALEKAAFSVHREVFGGEASREEVDRLTALARFVSADFVVALGGGKTIDTAKAVAGGLALQVAVVPTTASTDAPCSAIAVLYHPAGAFDCFRVFDANPSVVLVDTTIVARAPPRFLAAGMGDALATKVEARGCRTVTNCGGGLQTEACVAVCERCEEVLFRYGRQAYEANRAGVVTAALEAVVEANTLLSGLGFESGGVAAAHAVSGHDGRGRERGGVLKWFRCELPDSQRDDSD